MIDSYWVTTQWTINLKIVTKRLNHILCMRQIKNKLLFSENVKCPLKQAPLLEPVLKKKNKFLLNKKQHFFSKWIKGRPMFSPFCSQLKKKGFQHFSRLCIFLRPKLFLLKKGHSSDSVFHHLNHWPTTTEVLSALCCEGDAGHLCFM